MIIQEYTRAVVTYVTVWQLINREFYGFSLIWEMAFIHINKNAYQ